MYQYWQLTILVGVKNHRKLLSPLNSPRSVCAKYKISSKLEDLLFLVQNCDLKDDRCQYWQASRITKKFVTIDFRAFDLCRVSNFIKTDLLQLLLKTIVSSEFTNLGNYGLKDDRCQYWQVSNLTGIENHKKLLSLLNSPPSLCVECKILSKLEHLPFFVQNYGLTDDRCIYWQISIFTGIKKNKKNYCHHWIDRPRFVQSMKFHQNWSICYSSSKTMAWKMAGVKNHKKLLSSMNSAPSACSLWKISWKMVNFIPRPLF